MLNNYFHMHDYREAILNHNGGSQPSIIIFLKKWQLFPLLFSGILQVFVGPMNDIVRGAADRFGSNFTEH